MQNFVPRFWALELLSSALGQIRYRAIAELFIGDIQIAQEQRSVRERERERA